MARLVISVKRIEKEYDDKEVAQIHAFRKGRTIGYEVVSRNKLFKRHLEQVLAAPFHSVMPGPQGQGYYANHVEYFHPGTITFFTFLHDRLGWYGYVTDLMNKQNVTKSIFFKTDELDEEDFYDSVLTKSVNWGDYTRKNKEGHTILVTVPPGYVAVSTGGKVIGPGKKVGRNGADLDKPDAKWRLVSDDGSEGEEVAGSGEEIRFVKNPQWEQAYQLDPKAAKKQAGTMMMKLLNQSKDVKYHPGMHKELYGEDAPGHFNVPKAYKSLFDQAFNEGIALQNILEGEISGDLNDKELGGSDILPENVLMLSTDKHMDFQFLIPAHMFGKYKDKAKDWVMFDGTDYMNMPPETRAQLRMEAKKSGEKYHPGLIEGVFEKGKKVTQAYAEKYFDMSEALLHNIKDVYLDRINSLFGENDEDGLVTAEELSAAEKYAAEVFKESEAQLKARLEKIKRTPAVKKKIANVQAYDRQLEAEYFYRDPKDGKFKPKKPHEKMTSVKSLTGGKGSEDIYFDHMPDDGEAKGLMMHQIYGVKSLTHHGRYAAYGGPEENDGMFLQWKPGIGKSYTVLAADAVMRNKGLFKGTHVITAPRAVVPNWEKDLMELRKLKKNEDFFVIDGGKAKREQQWEEVRKLTEQGKAPKFVIIGSGKMMFDQKDVQEDPEDEDKNEFAVAGDDSDKKEELEFAMDMQKAREVLIETGNLAALTVDETGLFTNPETKKHMALRALVNFATSSYNTEGKEKKQRAVIWTLNGNLMGNSATDTMSEFGWVNSAVRSKMPEFINTFTRKVHKASPRRLFNTDPKKPGMATFMRQFGHSINRMNFVRAVGKNHKHVNEVTVTVGKEFASVYQNAVKKIERISSLGPETPLKRFKLGLITMLVNASYNSGKAQRLIEYGLDDTLQGSMKDLLSHADYHKFMGQVQKYRNTVAEYMDDGGVGWLPRAKSEVDKTVSGYTTSERDEFFEDIIDPEFRSLMHKVMNSGAQPIAHKGKYSKGWKNPLAEFVSRQVNVALKDAPITSRLRMGFQSQSRMVAEAVHTALGKKANMVRQLLAGGTKQKDIAEMQKRHAQKVGSAIMSVITGAATYGVNFNSDIAFVTEHWNPAKKEQGVSRFHRNIMRPITIYSLASTGVGSIIRDVARQKKAFSDAAEDIDFNDDDAMEQVLEKVMGTELSTESFLEKLLNRPILIEEDEE